MIKLLRERTLRMHLFIRGLHVYPLSEFKTLNFPWKHNESHMNHEFEGFKKITDLFYLFSRIFK